MIDLLNQTIEFWLQTHWTIALLMSAGTNILTYVTASWFFSAFFKYLTEQQQIGQKVDARPLKSDQLKREIKQGLITCLVLAGCSLMTRWWHSGIWPNGWDWFVWQVLLFALFYETYSYWIHRLLHTRTFSSVHAVHHRSTRVTPWTAYSVHPIEAVLIGITAPLFMLLLPLSLGVALCLHIMGMVFTIFIHANFQLRSNGYWARLLSASKYHVRHHQNGHVNYAFTTALWDRLMGTKKAS